MGANAQTSVPAFVSGQVLTAQQQTEINTGTPVFADTTARDAAFGGSGEKVLAEGQLAYIENLDIVQYYDGSSWFPVGVAAGLVHISTTAFTTVTSVSLPQDSFDASYRNYRVLFDLTATTGAADITVRYRTAGTDNSTNRYFQMSSGLANSSAASNQNDNPSTSFTFGNAGSLTVPYNVFSIDIFAPAISQINKPFVGGLNFYNGTNFIGRQVAGTFNSNTGALVVDSLSVISSVASSISGHISVYGYVN